MSTEETWSVLRLLTWTTDYLKQHHAESPRLDAEVLLAEVLGCSRVDLYTRFDYEPTLEERVQFKAMIQERAAGKPVAYLVGKKEFYSLDFEVNENVLIPRPETEFLLMGLFDWAKTLPEGMEKAWKMADVGTGSGILAITSAIHLKNSRVTAIDISPKALEVARKNVEKYASRLQNRVRLVQSDLFAALETSEKGTFDAILSNPPYVGRAEMGRELETNVCRYEPHVALFGGEKGTELISRLLHQTSEFLRPGGRLFMELSPMIHTEVVEMVKNVKSLEYLQTIRDLDRQERILVVEKK
ncbi:MAG: peptide chain release factor N(5)-glutamine methyltransferase [Planctomycetia bacterium]|nr:peptide chain release factor N(5)-glutamine methyltransferase [Planctomycetia bacterium]